MTEIRTDICPVCASDDILGGAIDIDIDNAIQPMHCVCGAQWRDWYKIHHQVIEKTPTLLRAFAFVAAHSGSGSPVGDLVDLETLNLDGLRDELKQELYDRYGFEVKK